MKKLIFYSFLAADPLLCTPEGLERGLVWYVYFGRFVIFFFHFAFVRIYLLVQEDIQVLIKKCFCTGHKSGLMKALSAETPLSQHTADDP